MVILAKSYWEKIIISLLLISVLSVTAGRDGSCHCDHASSTVQCSGLQITDFHKKTILCADFGKIDLSDNDLQKFPNDLHQFITVNMSHNSLTILDAMVNQKVEHLDVTRNNIVEIYLKDRFRSLRHLNASKNNLGFGNENFLQGHCDLAQLDVSENIIITLQPVTRCAQLSLLSAARNAISSLPTNLSMLTKLKTLDLSRNKLIHITEFPRELETLDLSGNRITEISVTTFEGLASLTLLNLDANVIQTIESGALSGLVSLQTLKLNGNKLKKLPSDLFHGLKSLTVAELSYNSIVKVSDNSFNDLPALERVTLSSNFIVSLPALRLGKNVRFVSLAVNLIKKMNLQAVLTMLSNSVVPRRVSFPFNNIQNDDPEWLSVVRFFSWECPNYLTSIKEQSSIEPPVPFNRREDGEIILLRGTNCPWANFTIGNERSFDTTVNADQMDGVLWLDAVEFRARNSDPSWVSRDDL